MCGIAGIVLTQGSLDMGTGLPNALVDSLRHRGPDHAGVMSAGPACLVHTRLSIIDVAGSDQPFLAAGADLIANGEIYNYRALRADMPDTAFTSQGDCEPPLHLWLRDGDAYATRLRGMYAIAIRSGDWGSPALTLSRDPFGIKPLYYAPIANGHAFASEPRALLDTGLVPRGLRPLARDELLNMQFTTGAETIFPGISRLRPGETIRIQDGSIAARHRIAALPEGEPETIAEDAALTRLEAALTDSVAAHMQSDVPYGLFLSAGIDSAAILACMARLDTRPVLAFTAGFDAPGAADEREAAAAMARAVGAQHETLLITREDCWRHLPEIVACMDDPAADYAIIPSWFLARRARQDVKVVLSGEGGDEMLAGYGRYRTATRPFPFARQIRARGALQGLGVLRRESTNWRNGFAASEREAATHGRTALQCAQAADIADWLPHDLLLKLDRCLMAHSIEGRTPFLDPIVAAATFRLPDALKIRNGKGKYLLRQFLASALPAARPFAPKQGFTVPVGAWIATDGKQLGDLVAKQECIAEIAHADRVRALFLRADRGREGMAAWLLLFYAIWHRAQVQGRHAKGSVFDFLQ